MNTAIRVLLLSILFLTLSPARSQAAPGPEEEVPVVVPEPTELAKEYARGNLGLWFLNQGWAIAVPVVVLVSGLSSRLRSLSERIAGRRFATVAVFASLYFGLMAIVELPLDYYEGYVRTHAYGLSRKPVDRWFLDLLKARGFGIGLGAGFLWVPYLVLSRSPRRWWLWLGLIWIPCILAMTLLKPIVYDPLFNRFGPMTDRALEADILGLARRAGIEGSRVFEVDKARDTSTVNAYVTGLMGTKRIVVWDTLLAKLDDREVLFVVGHEIGHYVLNHVLQGVAVSAILVLIGLGIVRWLSSSILTRSRGRWGFDRLSDLASLPLLIATGEVVALFLTPVGFAYSRYMEAEADRFAVEITRMNHSGGVSFTKLQRENLSIPRPDPFSRIVRSTHPSLAERIEFCNSYHPWKERKPLVYGEYFKE